MARAPKLRPGEKLLKAVRPNAGLQAEYRRRLYVLIDEMTTSVEHWILAAYRKEKPKLAMDDSSTRMPREPQGPLIGTKYVGGTRPWIAVIAGEPLRTAKGATIKFMTQDNALRAARRYVGEILPADELNAAMTELGEYWQGRFDESSKRLAQYFSRSSYRRTDDQLRQILADGGWTIKFEPTPGQLDILRAAVHENVGLIKSIPQQYLKNVEGLVMRSVQRGGDMGQLAKDLQHQYGVTKRRAAFIARDQNNKATSVFQEARRAELGIDEAIWMHSHGGKKPRPTHVAMDGKRYKIAEGMYDSAIGRNTWPGQEPNCRCVSRGIVKFSGQ